MTRRKATQKWQQSLPDKDSEAYEELNAEVYEAINTSPHREDSIGWHMSWPWDYTHKTGYARAWLRRLLWRYGTDLKGATRKNLYREAYRLYEDAVDRAKQDMFNKMIELIGEQPGQIFRRDIVSGKFTQEQADQAQAELKDWYGKLYAVRNAMGLTGGYADFETDWEITFTKKEKPTSVEDI